MTKNGIANGLKRLRTQADIYSGDGLINLADITQAQVYVETLLSRHIGLFAKADLKKRGTVLALIKQFCQMDATEVQNNEIFRGSLWAAFLDGLVTKFEKVIESSNARRSDYCVPRGRP